MNGPLVGVHPEMSCLLDGYNSQFPNLIISNMIPTNKKSVTIIVAILIVSLWVGIVNAETLSVIELPSSFNPVGSGARAIGMGGAFIAVADDATAASWNPGGLVQLQTPEVSMVGVFLDRTEDSTFEAFPVMSGKQSVYVKNINYLSATYPFSFQNFNMVVSLNYQYLYDLHRDWSLLFPITPTRTDNLAATQKGGLGAVGIAYAVQLTPDISLGITFNNWCDIFGANNWQSRVVQQGDSGTVFGEPVSYFSDVNDRYDFRGYNFNIGMLWNVNAEFSFGLVIKTPFSAEIKHGHSEFSELRLQSNNEWLSGNNSPYVTRHEELDMPVSYGTGFAYRFSDAFTVSADLYRTEWDDYKYTDYQGIESSPLVGKLYSESNLEPTHQLRLGMEYLIIKRGFQGVIPLRAGLFYDPAPAENSPDEYYGFSLGTGFSYKSLILDVAGQYRFGRNVGTSYLEELGLSQDVDEFTFYSSLIFHF